MNIFKVRQTIEKNKEILIISDNSALGFILKKIFPFFTVDIVHSRLSLGFFFLKTIMHLDLINDS
jgi:hypothetical protein